MVERRNREKVCEYYGETGICLFSWSLNNHASKLVPPLAQETTRGNLICTARISFSGKIDEKGINRQIEECKDFYEPKVKRPRRSMLK